MMPGARRPGSLWRWLVLAAVLVVVLVAAVAAGVWPQPSQTVPANTLMVASASDVTKARGELRQLVLAEPPGNAADYRRAAFGRAWTDTDGNGCNQRDDVLLRDAVTTAPHTVGRQGSCDHDVLSGTWVDPYSGTSITLTDAKQPSQAESVQIDHIVALSVAWRYGARSWTPERRLEFANDLRGLVASGGASNQSKGGSDAAQWRPVLAAQCGYATRYVTVKAAYALPVAAAEKTALAAMLATCP